MVTRWEFNSSDCQKMLIILSVLRFKLQIIGCGITREFQLIIKATSKGLTIGNVVVKKLSHRYTNLSDSIELMYYHRVIVNLRKLRQTHYTSSIC